MDNQIIYLVTHTNPELKTVGEFVNESSSPAFAYVNNIDAFLAIKDRNGVTNREAILRKHVITSVRAANEKKAGKDISLVVGTKLAVEADKINRCTLLTEGIEVVSNDITFFKADELAKLEDDIRYRPVDTIKPMDGQEALGVAQVQYPGVTVWIWAKALSDPGDTSKKGKIFNVTPYLTKAATNVTKEGGGHFQLSLAPVVCTLEHSKWVLKENEVIQYVDNDSLEPKQFFSFSNLYNDIYKEDDTNHQRNAFFFNNVISSNDLVFIRFETLEMEKDQRSEDTVSDFIDPSGLPGRIYDMIGLVDKVNIHISPANTDVSIDITGRDLSKLFYEDGCYFFPMEFTKGKLAQPGSASNDDPLMKRVSNETGLAYLGLYFAQPLNKIFQFIIQQLANVSIVPDELFSSYGDRRNSRLNLLPENVKNNADLSQRLEGIEKEVKDIIKDIRRQSGKKLEKAEDEEVKAKEIFTELKRFLQFIRDQKTRKVSNNATTGWKKQAYPYPGAATEDVAEDMLTRYMVDNMYGFRYERPTFTSYYTDKWIPLIDRYLDELSGSSKYKPEYTEGTAKGIWQIVKLLVDEEVSGRRLIDSSISNASGSLINLFKKVCQQPFVEYHMDTYEDMFFIMLRKAPFDRRSVLSALKGEVRTDNKAETRRPTIVNIQAPDVLNESLEFSDTQAISWYQLIPKATIFGQTDQLSTAMLPALYFQEYAALFGSKTMQLTHNYMPSTALNPTTSQELNIVQKQTVLDLKFMIESTAYLPFTRSGTIVINRDRRVKVGNFIRYKPTGEIFYVDAVQHNYAIAENTIDAYTTIQVSRGMVEQLIYGVPVENTAGADTSGTIASYFNIIETISEAQYNDLEKEAAKKAAMNKPVTPAPAPAPKAKDGIDLSKIQPEPARRDHTYVRPPVVPEPKAAEASSAGPAKTAATPAASAAPRSSDQVGQVRKQSLDANNDISASAIAGYTEAIWNIFSRFIKAINQQGYWVHVGPNGGYRTAAQQAQMKKNNGNNAKVGKSRHQQGTAIDLNIRSKTGGGYILKNDPAEKWIATGVPRIARTMGIQWAGGAKDGSDDGTFGNYRDRVHFQLTDTALNSMPDDPIAKLIAGSVPANEIVTPADTTAAAGINKEQVKPPDQGVVDLEEVFSHFKVNKAVFNYFVNRLQLNPAFQKEAQAIYANNDMSEPFFVPNIIAKKTSK
ncbi:M15 family metallopeptidase [Chitinophaga sp. 22321]|uniref:M15 family metallopeptidase n=1 Tax=Chitinophaga hostae TaxID=2831022 RepID=A0ABS5J8R2_9BACT|nr:M15 family metallopeptidase [Chitinophaga hostae]MBS0031608.1 M15 family metallopeptidase [Chitinophaga hostae]